MEKILIVDDNKTIGKMLKRALGLKHRQVLFVTCGNEALKKIEQELYNLVITDLKLDDMDGLDILKKAKAKFSGTEVIVMTAYGSIEVAVEAMRLGAYDFILKPFELSEMELKVDRALENVRLKADNKQLSIQNVYLKEEVNRIYNFNEIVGQSKQIQEILELIKKVADTNSTVLIQGESGTGKELVARAIHFNSLRRNKPFVKVNCAVFSEGVLESELFGHEKGSFTGASEKRLGRFEMANEGSIFLDEIGDLPLMTQVKILRVLQEQEFERVGSSTPIKVDIRLITATNQDLQVKIKNNEFREDLYYRINVVPIFIHPLRERREDIPMLINFFLEKYSREACKVIKKIEDKAVAVLKTNYWKGNIREMENLIERLIVFSDSDIIKFEDLPDEYKGHSYPTKVQGVRLNEQLENFERQVLLNALSKYNFDKSKAAKELGIKTGTLYYKMKRFKIE
jgi:DNA-binding NtrC family response regulator